MNSILKYFKPTSLQSIYLTSLRFQVPKATSVKMDVLWDVALCNLVDMDGDHPDDGDSKHL
jgi:hypothetical protein